ncbi:MAG: molecular chaperone DnaJ [Propionibacteriaceae bacterium]|jgi:curved DNA-binding protein CbpA|nr:molecular chaperone DnaJ [Propionibacteriaceae bacterium]MBT66653.1 molecular chaperone DnaJ [Synechococcus sp. NP17]|tara:strand:+ start:10219 stop:10773 length:555 start_codon:yes stop_codon:yes gene_type:complete
MICQKKDVMKASTHYERLGVSHGVDADTLRRAFRRLSKSVHPDTTMLPAEEAARQFQLLREAYDQLADPHLRQIYDAQLIQQDQLWQQQHAPLPSYPVSSATAIGERRPLSGGEWLALLMLVGALFLCLSLGVGVAWSRGMALQVQPSWLVAEQTTEETLTRGALDGVDASSRNSFESAFTPGT